MLDAAARRLGREAARWDAVEADLSSRSWLFKWIELSVFGGARRAA
jgi:hypothetical protein